MTEEAGPAPIGANLAAIRLRIDQAARACGRDPGGVTLVAVSKTHDAQAVETALRVGQTVFGENRVQEATAKFPGLRRRFPVLALHLIGGLQTNKAREAVRVADVIESLDRPRLADAIADAVQREGRCPELMVQVNVGEEDQKSGVAPACADAFIASCRGRFGDRLTGLMCIPPAGREPAPFFRALASLARHHGLPRLSMGMSADFELAIGAGATHVRVGTAIFGARSPLTTA